MKTRWLVALIALCAGVAALFSMQADRVDETSPAVLRVGILPDQSEAVLRQQYTPFLEYLSAATGVDVQLVLPDDYQQLVHLFRDQEVDLAHFGGLTYVRAHVLHDAEPLVMREVDMRFTSSFLVRGSDTHDKLADFKGKTFTFGSPLSTSGHLMPRHFLKTEMQLAPEAFFSDVRYSGTHDATAYMVRDGVVDLGVANSQIFEAMLADGRLQEEEVRVLWQTPPYTDYVWAVHQQLDENFKTRLRDAFLALRAENAHDRKILQSLQAEVFLPASASDFLVLQQIAGSLGLLDPHIQ